MDGWSALNTTLGFVWDVLSVAWWWLTIVLGVMAAATPLFADLPTRLTTGLIVGGVVMILVGAKAGLKVANK